MDEMEFERRLGYVYLFRCNDRYKIGQSKDPFKRKRQLLTGSPAPIWVVHTMRTPHYKRIEAQLHYQFADKIAE